jgi:hypothetical protein
MHGRSRQPVFDHLDPPAVHDSVVSGSRDGHSPPEVMRNPHPHADSLPRNETT